MGLLAVVIAAAVNGLALPLYVNHYLDATPEKLAAIKPVVVYNTQLNRAFDFIYIGAASLAVVGWSVAILKTHRLPRWLGWLGILLALITIIPINAGLFITSLTGFRVFVTGFAVWTVLIILSLRRSSI